LGNETMNVEPPVFWMRLPWKPPLVRIWMATLYPPLLYRFGTRPCSSLPFKEKFSHPPAERAVRHIT
jgi:hypothetical protein